MYTDELNNVFRFARKYARDNNFAKIEVKHCLLGLVNVENSAKQYLASFGIDENTLSFASDNRGFGNPSEAADMDELRAKAWKLCEEFGDEDVNCVHLLMAILLMKGSYAERAVSYLLQKDNTTTEGFFEYILDKQRELMHKKIYTGETSGNFSQAELNNKDNAKFASVYAGQSEEYAPPVFGTDLTEKAFAGKLDPVIGREEEVGRLIQTLSRRTKNNPVLIGDAGVGKTAVVEGLAQRIAEGSVPSDLRDKRIIEMDVAGMLAGTRYRGDFEEKLENILSEVKKSGNIILFIDEIHNLVGAGSSSESSIDAAEMLKPSLARGEIQLIGATTTEEYRKYIEKDPALERRFQPVSVPEPDVQKAVAIVKGIKDKFEKHHNVTITDDAVTAAVEMSVRYIPDRRLPDKAIDLIDEASSRAKINALAMPSEMRRLEKARAEAVAQQNAAVRSGNADDVETANNKLKEIEYAYEYEYADYKDKLDNLRIRLGVGDIAAVVSQWTGIPASDINRSEKEKLLNLEEKLAERVVGQRKAVAAIAAAVRRARSGIRDPKRPIGSFIFVGPTGVGKTELAKALNECLFGADSEPIRLDMSEYMDKQSVSKLIGAPPGYVGYEESGVLTEKVRRKPYSVVLFDEIEKAHPDIFNILLQILDEGRLTDSRGKEVDFKNTIIILTGNLGSGEKSIGFGRNEADGEEKAYAALKRYFRPEFLNRIDEIAVFEYLSEQEIAEITKLLCKSLVVRVKGTVKLKFTEEAVDFLAKKGYDREYGARPLKRALQKNVEDALAEKLIKGEVKKGSSVIVEVVNGELTFDYAR